MNSSDGCIISVLNLIILDVVRFGGIGDAVIKTLHRKIS